MVELKYKTRGNTSPYNKSKVFFASHPEDFKDCFDKITDLILQKQNCAIWYSEDQDKYSDEALNELCQMQLIIIPVTVQFLETYNTAKEVIFSYAEEKHIPILPIAMEIGIENAFNAICGNRQCIGNLDYNYHNSKANQKLTEFLTTVLVGDELADKIRQSFDGYIFLSYRKIDHAKAKKLMRTIHSDPALKGVAIWYDEYLVPGEKFTESIQELIQKSDVFMMVITPNITEKNNYVIEVEYPLAQKLGKPIIPIQMQFTNQETLYQRFTNLPSLTTLDDVENWHDIFSGLLGDNDKENVDYMKHLFYLGMAYLKGIDVEIDYEKAKTLLEESAIQGYIEAAFKLANMYEKGECTEQNYSQSDKWYNHVIQLIMQQHEEAKYFSKIAYSIHRLSYRSSGGRYLEWYKSLISLCDAYGYADEKLAFYYNIIANNAIGAYYTTELKKVKEGIFYYERALRLCTNAQQKKALDSRKLESAIYSNLGTMYDYLLNDQDTAREYYGKALHIRKRLSKENRVPETINDLILIYKNYSFLFEDRKEISTAIQYNERCVPLVRELLKLSVLKYDIERYSKDLISLYLRISKMYERIGKEDKKEEYLRLAEEAQRIS